MTNTITDTERLIFRAERYSGVSHCMTNTITDADRLTFLAGGYSFAALYGVDTFVVDGSINEFRAKIDERIIAALPHEKILVSELEDLRAKAAEADKLAALLQERDARIEYLQQFSLRGTEGEPASLHRAYGP